MSKDENHADMKKPAVTAEGEQAGDTPALQEKRPLSPAAQRAPKPKPGGRPALWKPKLANGKSAAAAAPTRRALATGRSTAAP